MEVAENTPDVFFIPIGDAAKKQVYQLVYSLRGQGISAEYDLNARSVKAQMKYADKIGAKYTVVIGDDEIAQGSYPVKNMSNGETVNVAPDEIVNVVKA